MIGLPRVHRYFVFRRVRTLLHEEQNDGTSQSHPLNWNPGGRGGKRGARTGLVVRDILSYSRLNRGVDRRGRRRP